MSVVQWASYGLVGLFALIVVAYVVARVAGLGWYRSKDEYDRTMFQKYFGNKNGDRDA